MNSLKVQKLYYTLRCYKDSDKPVIRRGPFPSRFQAMRAYYYITGKRWKD